MALKAKVTRDLKEQGVPQHEDDVSSEDPLVAAWPGVEKCGRAKKRSCLSAPFAAPRRRTASDVKSSREHRQRQHIGKKLYRAPEPPRSLADGHHAPVAARPVESKPGKRRGKRGGARVKKKKRADAARAKVAELSSKKKKGAFVEVQDIPSADEYDSDPGYDTAAPYRQRAEAETTRSARMARGCYRPLVPVAFSRSDPEAPSASLLCLPSTLCRLAM